MDLLFTIFQHRCDWLQRLAFCVKTQTMETKKEPSKDIHRMRGLFFLIGLAVSLAIVITAFQWRTLKVVAVPHHDDGWDQLALDVIPITEVKPEQTTPSKSAPAKSAQPSVEFVEASTEDIAINLSDLFPPDDAPTEIGSPGIAEPEPEGEEPFVLLAEVQPEPVGGYEQFYKQIGKTLRYPRAAETNRIEGKVFVGFVVEKDGTISNIKVERGIGYGCDEAAIKSMPNIRWKAGKQRGKPVRVKMILPITFSLG